MRAVDTMQRLNRHALHGSESGHEVFIEDVRDPDGRMYRIEYRCRQDGTGANAWVLHNPWGHDPYDYGDSHLSASGFICLGTGASHDDSPFDLDTAVKRTRLWCTGYSFLREHGLTRTRQMLPDW